MNRVLSKLILSLVVGLSLITSSLINTVNAESNGSDNIKILINHNLYNFDQPAVIINGSTMVPLRGIFEALGAEVKWDGNTKTITGTKYGEKVILTVGDTRAYKNKEPVTLEQPPQIINGSTMVPVRFISESLGAEVKWEGNTRTVLISSPLAEVTQRNHVLLDNYNGKISLIGEGILHEGNNKGKLALFYKIEGSLINVADQVLINGTVIYKDSSTSTFFGTLEIHNPSDANEKYVIGYHALEKNEKILRYDNWFPFEHADEMKKVTFNPTDAKEAISIRYPQYKNNELSSPIVKENDDAKVEITKLSFENGNITISGKFIPKHDLSHEYDMFNPVIVDPTTNRILDVEKVDKISMYEGIPSDFSYKFKGKLSSETEYVKFYCYNFLFNIDITAGKEYKTGREQLINQIPTKYQYSNDRAEVRLDRWEAVKIDTYYNDSFYRKGQDLLAKPDGKVDFNSVSYFYEKGILSGSYEPYGLWLSKNYSKVSFDVSIHKRFEDNGKDTKSKIIIATYPTKGNTGPVITLDTQYTKEEVVVLKEIEVSKGEVVSVELNVDNLDSILLWTEHNGNRVLLSNGYLTFKK